MKAYEEANKGRSAAGKADLKKPKITEVRPPATAVLCRAVLCRAVLCSDYPPPYTHPIHTPPYTHTPYTHTPQQLASKAWKKLDDSEKQAYFNRV
jgi:hypothetical protein